MKQRLKNTSPCTSSKIPPRNVEVVCSDGGGEISEDTFTDIYDGKSVKQEKTTTESPQVNRAEEQATGIIDAVNIEAINSGIRNVPE